MSITTYTVEGESLAETHQIGMASAVSSEHMVDDFPAACEEPVLG